MDRDVLDRWCERGILSLVLAILIFGPLALGGVHGLTFGIILGLSIGVLALWGLRLWINPRTQLLWPPICWAVIAFCLYAIIRYRTADIEYIARQEIIQVLLYGFLFVAILNNLHRQESTQIISFTLIFVAMAISFYAIYQFVTDSNYVWTLPKKYPHRASGTYISPNNLAGLLEILLPLALTYTIAGRVKPLTRILLGYASLVMLGGLAVTLSRGSWFATAGAMLGLFGILIFQRGYRIPAALALIALVVVTVFMVPRSFSLQMRIRRIVTEQGTIDDSMRFELWRPAYRMWQDYPWFGVGPGHFDARFRAYRPEGVQRAPDRTHNDYLNTLVDWGVVGAVLVTSAWVLLAIGIAKSWRSIRLSSGDLGSRSGSNKFAFVTGASLGLIAILIHSWVDFNMHIPANAILVVTLMAMVTGHLRFATERWWLRPAIPMKVFLSVVLLAGIGYFAPQAWRQATEFVWLTRAEHASWYSRQQVNFLKQAFAIEPKNSETARAIGEALRHQSEEGGEHYQGLDGANYRQLAQDAMQWFQVGMKLNPWDSRNYSGYGWCLDWLDRQSESAPYFSRAEELDPNNYFNLNRIGVHYVQLGDFAAAKVWFERSFRLNPGENPIAQNYLTIVNARMLEAATNEIRAKLDFSRP
ncbi:MAG TPA: O-antigen ligase family protein [Candidatus Limnocylindrales bacterium]|jgi:O-antigen ligase|nr:O-antigen ligase family protein [Candidatus Limnocylindrales bacterium]